MSQVVIEQGSHAQRLQRSPELRTVDNGRFGVDKLIGRTATAFIYDGFCLEPAAFDRVTIKLEPLSATHGTLQKEAGVMGRLYGGTGIPHMRAIGEQDGYRYLVLDRLGASLGDLRRYCGGKLSVKTVFMLADQLISRIETVHSRGYILAAISSHTFFMGSGNDRRSSLVYVGDLGSVSTWIDPLTKLHVRYEQSSAVASAIPAFASINTHLGIRQSRRDDMESLGYLLVYFICGGLPWLGLEGETKKDLYTRIATKKMCTDARTLCGGLPDELRASINYVRSLGFDEQPEYEQCRALFRRAMDRLGFQNDCIFDWTPAKLAFYRHRLSNKQSTGAGEGESAGCPSQIVAGERESFGQAKERSRSGSTASSHRSRDTQRTIKSPAGRRHSRSGSTATRESVR